MGGLLQRYGRQLYPQRDRSRKAALEWLAGTRVLDSLSLYPEVVREDAQRTAGALLLVSDGLETEPEASRPELNALYSALESRLMKSGGVDAVVPQNVGNKAQSPASSYTTEHDAPVLNRITSGQDLLAQARTLTGYLREQPDGWLAAHRLMKSLRHDTLSAIPAPDAEGKTRIEPPRADQRAMLKRLYLQQSWLEILEQADSTFSRGANHLWLDLQWYTHQALMKLGRDVLADIIAADLKGLLRRLTGLETLAFNDGTPFADEVTLNWINQSVLDDMVGWRDEPIIAASETDNDILALEPEALEKADSEGLDTTLRWLQTRPGTVMKTTSASIAVRNLCAPTLDESAGALVASIASLPQALNSKQIQAIQQDKVRPDLAAWLKSASSQLDRLAVLPPDWAYHYGNGLLAQAKALWPQKPEVAELQLKWQQRQAESKLPPDSLTGWHNGMQQLQALTDKLNGLDGQKGKYITVSELKSVVYEMTRSFSQTVPLEEQLRLMQSQQGDAALATQQQIQRHLNGVIQVYGEQGSKEGF